MIFSLPSWCYDKIKSRGTKNFPKSGATRRSGIPNKANLWDFIYLAAAIPNMELVVGLVNHKILSQCKGIHY